MDFKIRIADTVIHIHSIYDRVYHLCQSYFVSDDVSAALQIEVSPEDIEA